MSPRAKNKVLTNAQKAANPAIPQIQNMQESILSQGKDTAEYRARKNSVSHTLEKTDQLHQRKDPLKLRMEEFCLDIEFKFGVPILILDIIQAFTGYDLLADIKAEVSPPQLIERINPDDEQLVNYKATLIDDSLDVAWNIFNSLA